MATLPAHRYDIATKGRAHTRQRIGCSRTSSRGMETLYPLGKDWL
jgi:hypothetical protein